LASWCGGCAVLYPDVDPTTPRLCRSSVTNTQRSGCATGKTIDNTLPFLDGWLDIVDGRDAGRALRFVRVPGDDPVEITFGRDEGAPYRHVQLQDVSVSALPARMRLRGGSWWLNNLSISHPATHNGQPLALHDARQLKDGDRIDVGAVALRVHA
jgi:hypothetical protein